MFIDSPKAILGVAVNVEKSIPKQQMVYPAFRFQVKLACVAYSSITSWLVSLLRTIPLPVFVVILPSTAKLPLALSGQNYRHLRLIV